MKRTSRVCVTVVASVALGVLAAPRAQADLTLNGAVGLPLNPTAELPAPNSVRVQADYFDLGDTTATAGGASGTVEFKFTGIHAAGRIGSLPLELNGGFERLKARGTVNAGAGVFTGSASESAVAYGAKYLIYGGRNPLTPRVAIGAGYSKAMLRNAYAYIVASKDFGDLTLGKVPITGHLGIRYDRIDIKPTDFNNANFQALSNYISVYGGVEVPVTRSGELTLVGELQSKRTSVNKAAYSAAVRYRPRGQDFYGILGYQRQGLGDGRGVFAQIGYNFG